MSSLPSDKANNTSENYITLKSSATESEYENANEDALIDFKEIPIYLFQLPDGATIYGFPKQNGVDGLKIAFHGMGDKEYPRNLTVSDDDERRLIEQSYNHTPPKHIDRNISTKEVERMKKACEGRIPVLADRDTRLVHGAVCQYTMTPNEHFLLDSLHGTDDKIIIVSVNLMQH